MACVARCVAVVAVATAVCCCWCYVCFCCSCCRLTHGPTFVRNDSWPTVCIVCCLLCLFAVFAVFAVFVCVCCRHRRARCVAGLVSRRWRAVVVWYVHVVTPCMCCVPVLYRRGLLLSCVCVCVCVCLCVFVFVFVFVFYLSTLLYGRVLFGLCCALWCADGACRASSFPYGTRVHCPVHVDARVCAFALSVSYSHLQFRRRTSVSAARTVGEYVVCARVQLSCVLIRF